VLFVAACAGRHAAPGSVLAAAGAVPDRVFGIVLRQPLNPRAVVGQRCFTARQFALEDGFYSIVTDDALFNVPHEHQDTAAVLAALDSRSEERRVGKEGRSRGSWVPCKKKK